MIHTLRERVDHDILYDRKTEGLLEGLPKLKPFSNQPLHLVT